MEYTTIMPYFTAVAALTAAPGPLMAVLVVRSIQRDAKGAAAFAAGLCAGDVVAVTAVALGVGFWAQSMPGMLTLGKYLGVAYLLWLAVQVWNDRSGAAFSQPHKESWLTSAGAGMAICLGNPSTLLLYMLLLPSVAPTGFANFEQLAIVVLVTLSAVGGVFFGTILLARQVSRIIATPASSNMLARIAAAAMGLCSVWILMA